MAFNNPVIADFKAQFTRDFPYSTDPALGVMDADIGAAFNLVNININQNLYPNQQAYTVAYNYLAAHYLVLNLRASSQGINGQYNWIQNTKAVQGVSEGFSIPQRILDNPELSQFAKTNYGSMWLNLVLPQLSGQMWTAFTPARAL